MMPNTTTSVRDIERCNCCSYPKVSSFGCASAPAVSFGAVCLGSLIALARFVKKFADDAAELFGHFQMGGVAGPGKDVRASVGDVRHERLPSDPVRFVVFTGKYERGDGNGGQPVDDRPIPQCPGAVEFGGAEHLLVDGR